MSAVYDLCVSVSNAFHPHIAKIALSLAATLLFLYGQQIHGVVKGLIKDLHFLLRLLILVVVCAFGYGTLGFVLTRLIELGLGQLDRFALGPVVIGLFLLVGLLAERNKAM
jgi:hypothetical protein